MVGVCSGLPSGETSVTTLLAHNYYGSSAPSGENLVFEGEVDLLRRQGVSVKAWTAHSDWLRERGVLGLLVGGIVAPWNFRAAAEIRRMGVEDPFHVLHVHNTFPLFSPSIFWSAGSRAARVLTLHNYRLFCAAGIPMRDERVCTDCLIQRSAWPGLRHGCYRASRLATVPLSVSIELHRRVGTWSKQVDAYIALSEFQKEMMIGAGLPRELVHVKPNFYPGDPAVTPWACRDEAAVFAGRLSEEKGVGFLVRAWREWGPSAPELRIVGDGPLRAELEREAGGCRVRFLGQMPAAGAVAEIAKAKLLLLPSVCFEGFPMTIREALAHGTPCAVSNLGPLPSIVKNGETGVVFRAGDAGDLLAAVVGVWESGRLEAMGAAARREFEAKYTEDVNYRQLMDIYGQAIEVRKSRQRKK